MVRGSIQPNTIVLESLSRQFQMSMEVNHEQLGTDSAQAEHGGAKDRGLHLDRRAYLCRTGIAREESSVEKGRAGQSPPFYSSLLPIR